MFFVGFIKTAVFDHHNDGSEFQLSSDRDPPPISSPKGQMTPPGDPVFAEWHPKKAVTAKKALIQKATNLAMGSRSLDKLAEGGWSVGLCDTAPAVSEQLKWTTTIGDVPNSEWAKAMADAARKAKYKKARKNVV